VWNSYFGFVITFVAIFTLVPYLTSLITSWLGHLSKIILVDNLGNNSQLVVGGLGVIIHELGHAIFAYLFGHKVTHVQLLNLNYRQSGALGSVDHRWNDRNVYQMLGNFFIGLAPYYMCSLALFLLQKYLLNAQFSISSLTQSLNINTTLSASMIFDSVLDNLKSRIPNCNYLRGVDIMCSIFDCFTLERWQRFLLKYANYAIIELLTIYWKVKDQMK